MYVGEESGKSCCGVMVTQTVSIRWFIVMIAFVGICCAVVGTVLGAMRSSGREHLTVSLLMIGKLDQISQQLEEICWIMESWKKFFFKGNFHLCVWVCNDIRTSWASRQISNRFYVVHFSSNGLIRFHLGRRFHLSFCCVWQEAMASFSLFSPPRRQLPRNVVGTIDRLFRYSPLPFLLFIIRNAIWRKAWEPLRKIEFWHVLAGTFWICNFSNRHACVCVHEEAASAYWITYFTDLIMPGKITSRMCLFPGVGIVLITVSTIAWRLTSQDAPSCRAMLGLGGSSMTGAVPVAENGECGLTGGGGGVAEPSGRRFLSRIPPTYGRPHHPYAAMMYPEFQYRPPPPSYQASMQEYRLRLLLLDRDRHQQQMQQQQQQQQHSTPLSRACVAAASNVPPVSPPPTYRSQANTLRYLFL